MGKKKKQSKSRAEPMKRSGAGVSLCSPDLFETLCCSGYTSLADNPEIQAAVNKIAGIVSSMTIYLMENREIGDIRVINGMSRLVDIAPNRLMTKKTFISGIVRSLLLEGNGNAVVWPVTRSGYIEELKLIEPYRVGFLAEGDAYKILIDGKEYSPEGLCHFLINPSPSEPWKGTGYKTALRDVAGTLKQAGKTKKGFMESKWKPSVIVKVDSMSDELSNPDGRREILNDYVATSEAGEPWILPAETFEVKEIRPLSLSDLAISDSVKMDKITVASILDVPPCVVGAGEFKEGEWNNFIKTRIGTLCDVITQELTKKILIKPEWYYKFNMRSMYAYDIKTLASTGVSLKQNGVISGNEVRDWIDMSPKEGLDEISILENYIPTTMIGNQSKLKGGAEDE